MAGRPEDDPLAYGHYSERGQEHGEDSERAAGDAGGGGARGLLGSTARFLRDKYSQHQQQPQPGQPGHPYGQQAAPPAQPPSYGYGHPPPPAPVGQQQHHDLTHSPNPSYHGEPTPAKPPATESGLLGKIQTVAAGVGKRIAALDPQAAAAAAGGGAAGQPGTHTAPGKNRYGSFAPERDFNDAKWYVDGCSYMWAVSRALETAKESIWILDWWLSPELYLRRPPAKNEQYRLDRMLHAAAQRGVKVNIIVYKEVTQALSLCSHHTKHHLEKLHPNIGVFRYPDHTPDRQTIHTNIVSSLQNLTLNPAGLAKLSGGALTGLYGIQDDVILYWAHHEKLCLIDGKTAFMGGLDLCYGRWDTHNHPIADAHPADIKETVFPGQDYNNGRILDFQDVVHWENNQLDRQSSSRMGWSDVSLCLSGPVVEDLQRHFVERWNYIYDQKYAVRKDARFAKLALPPQRPVSSSGHGNMPWSHHQQELAQGHATQQPHGFYSPPPPAPGSGYPPPPGGQPYFPPPPGQAHGQPHSSTPGYGQQTTQSRAGLPTDLRGLKDEVSNFGKLLRGQVHRYQDQFMPPSTGAPPVRPNQAKVSCQIVRSVSKWSIGAATTEASIAEAYATVIRESEHFVYIENQFFITATGDAQKPVKNLIGAAIVERILRAARAGQKYKMIVVIPSVPGFAGDLHEEGSLGTRAIMEFQYNSINRGGHSILEKIAQEGFNPMEYIRFYNLRNYDRINVSGVMKAAELASGVTYGQAQQQYDTATTAPKVKAFDTTSAYPQYQQYAPSHTTHNGRWDTVSSCYMLGGEDIRNVPWEHGGAVSEIDAFVSEELYVHSKVLIADDRTVICGSANINDRSQLGYHDSEIAVIVQDAEPIETTMDGRPWVVSRFAATLRRHLCRKHLGLIPVQDHERGDANCEPVGVPNLYDFGTTEDQIVADPLSDRFQSLWNERAKTNTEVFRTVFHAVPDDKVRNWNDYKEFYEYYFVPTKAKAKEGESQKEEAATPGVTRYQWGHVVKDEFPGGAAQVKEELSKVKGTLVEMPLMFLIEEDIAQEGIGLNTLTEEIYT